MTVKVTTDRAMAVTNTQFRSYGGRELGIGEVFDMIGLRNDELLLRYGYAKPFPKGDVALDCASCGRLFAHEQGLSTHMRNSHTPGRYDPLGLEEKSPPMPTLEDLIPPRRVDMGAARAAASQSRAADPNA